MKTKKILLMMTVVCLGAWLGGTALTKSNVAKNQDAAAGQDTAANQDTATGQDTAADQGAAAGQDSADAETGTGLSEDDDLLVGTDTSTWSPFADYNTLDEAETAAGFRITVPDSIDGYSRFSYAVMSDELIQVTYYADDNHYICIRKTAETDGGENGDISGDYRVYEEESTRDIDGRSVRIKGNQGNGGLALWTDGGYTYSLMIAASDDVETGIPMDDLCALVQQIN